MSSGQQHRLTESEWVAVPPKKAEPKSKRKLKMFFDKIVFFTNIYK